MHPFGCVFYINNSSNYLVSCNSRQSSQSTLCSSSDYWGLGSSIQAWDSNGDPNTAILEGISYVLYLQQEQEQEAYDNISSQSPSDIPDSTNSQTTSIIGVISNFISSLSTIQTGSCELILPFPNFAGGSQVVNPCSGKEKAPSIVQIGSSMLLIGTFIPLAFIVLKMIYNEIRSWTNG